MNVDARKGLYSAKQEDKTKHSEGLKWTPEQVGTAAGSFTWKELETRFREIQANAPITRAVSATFTRTEWDSGSVTEEWNVGGNPSSRKEFEHLASIATRKLGYTASEGANEYWLDRIRRWMQQERLDKDRNMAWCPLGNVSHGGAMGTTQHLFTERIVALSAMFCTELMVRGTPESAISLPSERSEIAEIRQGQIMSAHSNR